MHSHAKVKNYFNKHNDSKKGLLSDYDSVDPSPSKNNIEMKDRKPSQPTNKDQIKPQSKVASNPRPAGNKQQPISSQQATSSDNKKNFDPLKDRNATRTKENQEEAVQAEKLKIKLDDSWRLYGSSQDPFKFSFGFHLPGNLRVPAVALPNTEVERPKNRN